MNKLLFTALFTFASIAFASGQCMDCQQSEPGVDFCYRNPAFTQQCAQFFSQKPYFFINGKKKAIKLPAQGTQELLPYLISLSKDSKLKLSGEDLLFVSEAVKAWQIESRKFGYEVLASGLGVKIIRKGEGALPVSGKNVVVHYQGYLENGSKFDSSVDRGSPFTFPLGAGRVIKGWDEGIALLPIGTKAWLRIPPDLGYGSRNAGSIPPNSTLYFEVEVLEQPE